MRKARKNTATRQVIHIVGEGLTELFYFSHLAATERALKQYLPTYDKTRKYLEKDKWVKEMLADSKMDRACELAEKYKGRDSYSEIYKAIKKVSE